MARTAKWLSLAVSVFAVLLGLLWIGRGTAAFPFPEQNFMVGQMQWAWRGIALVGMGAFGAFFALRISAQARPPR